MVWFRSVCQREKVRANSGKMFRDPKPYLRIEGRRIPSKLALAVRSISFSKRNGDIDGNVSARGSKDSWISGLNLGGVKRSSVINRVS
jgi:hypothetical protein